MRLILDANQVEHFCRAVETRPDVFNGAQIVLTYGVFCEQMNRTRPNYLRFFEAVQHVDWRLASDKFLELEKQKPRHIRNFDGLYDRSSRLHQMMAQLMASPTDADVATARSKLEGFRQIARNMATRFFEAREKLGGKIPAKIYDHESLKKASLDMLVERTPMRFSYSDVRLLDALMSNIYIYHHNLSNTAHFYSQMGFWKDSKYNCPFEPDRDNGKRSNDYVDMMLPAFAAEGDVILTRDSHLILLGQIATENKVHFKSVEDFLGAPTGTVAAPAD